MLLNDCSTEHFERTRGHPEATNCYEYRWLNGEEYDEMLTNMQHYIKKLGFPLLNEHPEEIYYEPKSNPSSKIDGYVYYLRKNSLRNLGFPRLKDNSKKLYKWKKMNFQTPLPKHNPKVSYIVCSTTTSNDDTHFRMHIVQQHAKKDYDGILLCHVLQIQGKLDQRCTFKRQAESQPRIQQIGLVESEINYEEIRDCKNRLQYLIDQSNGIIMENTSISLQGNLMDSEYSYIYQKLNGFKQYKTQMFLLNQLSNTLNQYTTTVQDAQDVIQMYNEI